VLKSKSKPPVPKVK